MRRIKLIVEYDGTAYAGWQRQLNALSVQQVLEEAISALTLTMPSCVGSSRTDAGVHALMQTVHFDTECAIPGDKFSYALNTKLPPDIRVRQSADAAPDFHARFMAEGKRYRYQIHSAPHASALYRHLRAQVIYPLDIERMQQEALSLLGTHDFAAFAASGSIVKDTVRHIHAVELRQDGELIELFIAGNAFLYNIDRKSVV